MTTDRRHPSHLGRRILPTLVVTATLAHAVPVLTAVGPLRTRLFPGLAGQGAPGGVALTFDDGPDPDGTPAVLATLDRLGYRATFFLLGSQVCRYPEVARQVAAAGHEIAVHGYRHLPHLVRSPGALLTDLRDATDVISEVTGGRPRWCRPPYGVLTTGSVLAARAVGLAPVLWTAWGRDWRRTTPRAVADTVLTDLRPGGTVLLHDSDCTSVAGSWHSTVAALPLLAERIEAHGWRVRTLTEHLGG